MSDSQSDSTDEIDSNAQGEVGLLREWSTSPTAMSLEARVPSVPSAAAAAPDSTPPVTPPVAPAIILSDNQASPSLQRAVKAYSYPVVTLVSNVVRNASSQAQQMGHQISNASTQVQQQIGNHIFSPSGAPASTERELSMGNDLGPLRGVAIAPVAPEESVRTILSEGSASRGNADAEQMMDGEAEFVLLDGDLIALPAQQPLEMTNDSEDTTRSSRRGNPRACQNPPMRRVRGIKKWIKKKTTKVFKRNSKDKNKDRNISTCESSENTAAATSNASETASIRSESSAVAVSPKKKEKKSRRRISWRRTDSVGDDIEDTNASLQEVSTPSLEAIDETVVPAAPVVNEMVDDALDAQRAQTSENVFHASFVGNADQVLEAGVLAATATAEAYIEQTDEKKDDGMYASVLPRDADYKVDKADAPDVDFMLRRAVQESDIEAVDNNWGESSISYIDPLVSPAMVLPGKTDSDSSCPLSTATEGDKLVHNDVLKIVMVGAPTDAKTSLAKAIRQSNKRVKRRSTLGVDVHSWIPENSHGAPVKFTIWDVQGSSREDGGANFGANAGIQSLFFTGNTLYLLVWDLASSNARTYSQEYLGDQMDNDDSDSEDDEEEDNAFLFEEAKRQADLALQADIENRVLSWVDSIARRGTDSAILPIALIPEDMKEAEAKRRCDMMQSLLEHHIHRFENDITAPKLLTGMDKIICVSLSSHAGLELLQDTLLAIASDGSVFEHVGAPVQLGLVSVLETIRRLKRDHKLVRVDHLMSALGGSVMNMDDMMDALHFLASIGEILYFGTPDDDILSDYIILSRKWFVSALSCILRNDLKRELDETRRFMNMQCIYSDHQFHESEVIQSLVTGRASSCPLVSSTDTNMLWQSMSFMREAADRSSELAENSTTTSTMFGFLERLLVYSGIFLPLGVSNLIDDPEVYFVPSLMATADHRDLWTYKSSESYMTTLCHSWLFRDGAPSNLMEHITVSIVRDLYEFSRKFQGLPKARPPHREQSFPLRQTSMNEFLNTHLDEAMGRIKIHQLMCWKSSFLVKVGCLFADPESGDFRESFVEVFVTLVDQSSRHCVASDAMSAPMQRLVVSGKGQDGNHGSKLWKGGYGLVVDSVKAFLASFPNTDRQVVCPACLAHCQPRCASTWSWDSVRAAAGTGNSEVRCIRGHPVDANLICGTCTKPEASIIHEGGSNVRVAKRVPELLGSVVVVALWDPCAREIRSVGSGFIVNKKLGLVVTAGHVLFDMKKGSRFGAPYFGVKNAKAVIGVIPDEGGHNAVFRYFAEIVADDVQNVDACVLRITCRLENDVDGDMAGKDHPAIPLDKNSIQKQQVRSLKMTDRFELEETVRILGFNQGGEGVLEQGKHVNRSADFAKGYICRNFKAPAAADDSSEYSESSTKSNFSPREEIVVMCPTISGHSGGPCVNNDGKVVGILSRADPVVPRQRCYLVPASELRDLVKEAKRQCLTLDMY